MDIMSLASCSLIQVLIKLSTKRYIKSDSIEIFLGRQENFSNDHNFKLQNRRTKQQKIRKSTQEQKM